MAWEASGNTSTDPARDFLGTQDNQPIVVETNNDEARRVNGNGGHSSKVEIAAQDGLCINGFQPPSLLPATPIAKCARAGERAVLRRLVGFWYEDSARRD